MTFIERLDELIELRNTSRQAVAEYAGLAKSTISEWSRTGALPRADIAIKMAEYLKTSVEYLIIGKETDNTPVIKELKKQLDMFQKNIDKLV
jgi:transcriptional regulator with XRE-family HTH domain